MSVIQVAAGLVYRDGRYLIARRLPGGHLGGYWEFPGGKREEGESLETCLARELREELNISIGAPALFQVVRHAYPEKTVELHFFHCHIESGEAEPLQCAEIRWVKPEELTQFQFPPADDVIIEQLSQRVG